MPVERTKVFICMAMSSIQYSMLLWNSFIMLLAAIFHSRYHTTSQLHSPLPDLSFLGPVDRHFHRLDYPLGTLVRQ